ncbi:MAG: hypothetical protein AABX72_02950 [Nanoarchaeota archaeon]
MDSLEQSLYDFIGRELHELAWKQRYPIHPNVALWSFFEAARHNDFGVIFNDQEAQLSFSRVLQGHTYFLHTTMSFDDILRGWGNYPPGCAFELYNSMYNIYDRIGKELPLHVLEAWDELRNNEPRIMRGFMEDELLIFSARYHEHLLLPATGKPQPLAEPHIIYDILREFPLELYREADAYALGEGCFGSPTAETLYDILGEEQFDMQYHPSESCLTELFWAQYLARLAQEKGYAFTIPAQDPVRYLAAVGERALKSGREIWKLSA